jgi:predicted ATPase
LGVLREALAGAQQTGVHEHDAELYRLKGELTLQAPGSALKINEAEACYHTALDIARRQQAKSLELRAATSLARLWQQQGKTTEARNLLAPVYNWFTEGFDMADLKDAKSLLDALA